MPPLRKKPRVRAERAGRLAERLAALYFRLQLYGVLARRYKAPVGEIDLILSRFGTLVFVEVKGRARTSDAREALERVNTRRIVRAAGHFLGRHPELADRPIRFDVIFLARNGLPRHVKNAFDASGDP